MEKEIKREISENEMKEKVNCENIITHVQTILSKLLIPATPPPRKLIF